MFKEYQKGQIVWVPRVVLDHGASRRTLGDRHVECEVVEHSRNMHPSVKINRNDNNEDAWVNKQMIEDARPI